MENHEIIAIAEKILIPHFAHPKLYFEETVGDYLGAPNQILRCSLQSETLHCPASIIIKRPKRPQKILFREWAALAFLKTIPEIQTLFPQFYGGHQEEEVLVLEDLSSNHHNLLGFILEGENLKIAQYALLDFQRALGKMHAATIDRFDEFKLVCSRLSSQVLSRHRVHRILESLEHFLARIQELELAVTPILEKELIEIRQEIENPGPFLAFNHGDATPANAFYEQAKIRIFDFETAEFRHALLDGSFARIRYLHSVWACALPLDFQKEMTTTYRNELIKGCPEAADETLFQKGFLACSAGWLAGILEFIPMTCNQDKQWGRSTMRQRVIAGLEHYLLLADEMKRFPAFSEVCFSMLEKLKGKWAAEECKLPTYNAFTKTLLE